MEATRGCLVISGTMLQDGRSRARLAMMLLDSSVELILSDGMWPWSFTQFRTERVPAWTSDKLAYLHGLLQAALHLLLSESIATESRCTLSLRIEEAIFRYGGEGDTGPNNTENRIHGTYSR
jgi:hypothetical protein